ncbi:FecR family protein [Chitinophaga qingshengii]|uniref:FecR domain-containing protein n=1 Tax=Chitinophaga qingshengii TaxID=1569794 RepID=A0ABR7TF69_9BACT|nr:FecR family protein [Chitinophaga qingshengii]MBC9928967.1 FecR domain-containing protein [Chitinophaga qingshengii]
MPEDQPFDTAYYEALANKWLEGTITPRERELLDQWYQQGQDEQVDIPASFVAGEAAHDERIRAGIRKKIAAMKVTRKARFPRRWQAAAAILILVSAGAYLLFVNPSPSLPIVKNDTLSISPGSSKAVLTLGNGFTITLDSTGRQVIQQGHTRVQQTGGRLTYAATGTETAVSLNTLHTPRGGQFQLTLPDGTRAWLNAASSITFPTAFTGKNRSVTVTGEVYFEVAQNAAQPFFVHAGAVDITVLGTRFNVMAYTEETAIRATLLQGSIRVGKLDNTLLLKPGEQAGLPENSERFTVSHPNLEQVIAWKDGIFRFKDENIVNIMQQLARWYDIEPVFKGNMAGKDFSGTISRGSAIQEVLHMLALTEDIHFKIEGRKVIVSAP